MFYNPAMAADRDLAVAFVRAWTTPTDPPRSGWDVTAATGIRGLRLLHETRAFDRFTFTEPNDTAFPVLAENVRRHPGARALHADGRAAPEPGAYDYVDVDPYGSPLPLLRPALGATRTGGVLAVTATDLAVLAGGQPAATRRLYGAVPVRGRLGPEGGLRILLMRIAEEARRVGRSARPLLSYVREHYVRTFVAIAPPRPDPDPLGPVDPDSWTGPFLGTGGPLGPFWLGPLQDPGLVQRLEPPPTAARARVVGSFLERLRLEAEVDRPFFYEGNTLASRLRLKAPPALADLTRALEQAGFRAARTHARPEGLRTDAPREAVEEIARRLGAAAQSQNARVRA